MAVFGMGFVIGPAISSALPLLSTREKIRVASLLPLAGLIITTVFFEETKTLSSTDGSKSMKPPSKFGVAAVKVVPVNSVPVSMPVLLLVLNGFLLMYAFSTESIYAIFMKESFGYGERALSTLFACSGLVIGIIQIFFIRPIVASIGKHATLGLGNVLLAVGMIGVALVREQSLHFLLFGIHVLGYSVADTALVSLISRYSAASSQVVRAILTSS